MVIQLGKVIPDILDDIFRKTRNGDAAEILIVAL